MIITTYASYLEVSVKPGDWLQVKRVTFARSGSPSVFHLVMTSKDTAFDFQAQFVEAFIRAPS